jgi:hypothetical protein
MPFNLIKRGFSLALLLGITSTIGAIVNGNIYTSSAILALFGLSGLIVTNLIESELNK